MMKLRKFILLFIALLLLRIEANAQLVPNLGGQRAGISAFQFLKIGVGARAVAMGETFVAVSNDVTGLYWNPAGLTQFEENQFIASHTEYVVDIKHEFFGAVYHLTTSDALGFAVTSLYTPEMKVTTETQPTGTGRYFRFSDIAAGISYSRKMTDQFSFGFTIRYVEETLDIIKMRGTMVDFGTFYWTGLGSSRFAVVVTNFGPDVSPKGEVTLYNGNKVTNFQAFSPPTQFKIGFAFEPVETESDKVTTSIELQHPNDNSENLHGGIEYTWNHWLSLRAGVKRTIGQPVFTQDNTNAGDYTAGFGVVAPTSVTNFMFDYAFVHFNLLGSVHRLSVGFSF